jgi:hypothetical protein
MTGTDMPSEPGLSRDAALHRVRVLLGSLYDEDRVSTEARDALLAAIVDYGHASATEAVNQCQATVREELYEALRAIIWSWEHGMGGFSGKLDAGKAALAKAREEVSR